MAIGSQLIIKLNAYDLPIAHLLMGSRQLKQSHSIIMLMMMTIVIMLNTLCQRQWIFEYTLVLLHSCAKFQFFQ